MKTCKNCKWWTADPVEHEYTIPVDPDTYKPMKMPFEVRLCKHPKLLFCERPIESNGFAVADGSTYMANLITAEDFSCIHCETNL